MGKKTMEDAVIEEDKFAEFLKMIKSFTRFLRDRKNRVAIVFWLIRFGKVELAKRLSSFSAGFAKWRYETLAHCFESLNSLRILCESWLEKCVFNNVADEDHMADVMKACKCNRSLHLLRGQHYEGG